MNCHSDDNEKNLKQGELFPQEINQTPPSCSTDEPSLVTKVHWLKFYLGPPGSESPELRREIDEAALKLIVEHQARRLFDSNSDACRRCGVGTAKGWDGLCFRCDQSANS